MPVPCKIALVVLVGISLSRCDRSRNLIEKSSYSIPQPKIEVFTPKGFRVSIEDYPGIRLFAFHGNVNREMTTLEAGSYSKETRSSQNGRWIIEDKQIRLRVGDKVYYWVFVMKDNLGYRLEGKNFEVKELLPAPSERPAPPPSSPYDPDPPFVVENLTEPPKRKPSPGSTTIPPDYIKNILLCEETIINTTQALLTLKTEVDKLKKLNKQLVMGLNEYPGSKQLKLSGRIPPDGPAVSVLEFILKEKLDVKPRLLWAIREGNEAITFEVPSVVDKFELLDIAKEKLKNSKFSLS